MMHDKYIIITTEDDYRLRHVMNEAQLHNIIVNYKIE